MPNKTVGPVRLLFEERQLPRAAFHNENAIDLLGSFVAPRVSWWSRNQEERHISRASSDFRPIAFATANPHCPARQSHDPCSLPPRVDVRWSFGSERRSLPE